MSATGAPILVVTSSSSPGSAVVPVLAALDAAGADLHAIDVGRLGTRSDGVVQSVVKAIAHEVSGRRLARELDERAPRVALAFDPTSAAALSELRGGRPIAIVAVVAELDPRADWSEAVADRFLVVDEHAASLLQEHGADGDRIVVTGPLAPAAFVAAGFEPRAALRERFKIAAGDPVVLVEVGGLGYEATAQLALQLSLTASRATFLFAAGGDAEAAAALRAKVPTLSLRAKLFGATADAPLYYRAADVAVTAARPASALAALAVGARVVVFGDDRETAEELGAALASRGLGGRADSTLLISAALEPLIAAGPRPEPAAGAHDGAGNVADLVLVMAEGAAEIAAESAAAERVTEDERPASEAPRAASQRPPVSRTAGDLEDLGGEEPAPAPRPRPAPASSSPRGASPPPRTASPPPRTQARSVEEQLSDLKRGTGPARPAARGDSARGSTVDDELEALKRKMAAKKKGTP